MKFVVVMLLVACFSLISRAGADEEISVPSNPNTRYTMIKFKKISKESAEIVYAEITTKAQNRSAVNYVKVFVDCNAFEIKVLRRGRTIEEMNKSLPAKMIKRPVVRSDPYYVFLHGCRLIDRDDRPNALLVRRTGPRRDAAPIVEARRRSSAARGAIRRSGAGGGALRAETAAKNSETPRGSDSAKHQRAEASTRRLPVTSGYRVQLGALRSEVSARLTWSRVRKAHADLLGALSYSVSRVDLGPPKGVYYRLSAGSMADANTARRLCAQLKHRRQGCFVVTTMTRKIGRPNAPATPIAKKAETETARSTRRPRASWSGPRRPGEPGLRRSERPVVEITYCRRCGWLLRAGRMAQELLATFSEELGGVTLIPDGTGGDFEVRIEGNAIWLRNQRGRFPEIKELKQLVRDRVAPQRNLGHVDTPARTSPASSSRRMAKPPSPRYVSPWDETW